MRAEGPHLLFSSFFFHPPSSIHPPPTTNNRCAACTAARKALGEAAGALGTLATPLTLDLTASGAAAAVAKVGVEGAAAAPGVIALLAGQSSARLPPGDAASPAAVARLALDHAAAVAASKLGVASLGDGEVGGATKKASSCGCGKASASASGSGSASASSSGCGCGGAHAKAEAGGGGRASSSTGRAKASARSSSTDSKDDALPRATAFFGRGTRVRSLDAASLQALRASKSASSAVLVAFIAPWCGHCQAAKPELNEAADALARAGSAGLIASVDCTVDRAACDAAGVRGFPTLRWYGPGGREEEYGGARSAAALEEFVAARAPRPPPEIRQLTSQGVLEGSCLGGGARLCLLAFLPHLADSSAADRSAALAALKDAAAPYAGRPYAWLWAAGGDHPGLEAALGASYGFPAFLALVPPSGSASSSNPAKVAHFKGAFEAAALRAFVEGARAGRVGAAPVAGDLAVTADVAEWDGSDAAVDTEDGGDEFSLADLGLA